MKSIHLHSRYSCILIVESYSGKNCAIRDYFVGFAYSFNQNLSNEIRLT